MTYDELLAEIDDNLTKCGDDCESCRRDNAPWFALRAVVELHKPIEGHKSLCSGCWFGDGMMAYRCPTIQAIEKELG